MYEAARKFKPRANLSRSEIAAGPAMLIGLNSTPILLLTYEKNSKYRNGS
jgi:hypothetical protein